MDKNTSLYEFGYNFLGPICSEYFHHLAEYSACFNKPRLLFLAREGYFFQRAYRQLAAHQLINPLPNDYLYVSRTFLFRINIADPETWQWSLSHKFKGTLAQLLSARFAFSLDQIESIYSTEELEQQWILPEQLTELEVVFSSKIHALDKLVKDSRMAYLDYLSSLAINCTDDLIMLDVGYSGTIQKLLTKMLDKNTNGLYFIATKEGEHHIYGNQAQIRSVFKQGVTMGDGYTMLDRSLFLESLLTAPEGQFIDIAKTSEYSLQPFIFLFGRHANTQRNFHELNRLMQGAEDAICYAFKHQVRYSPEEIEMIYEQYAYKRNLLPSASWSLFDVDDAISGNGNVNPLQLFGM